MADGGGAVGGGLGRDAVNRIILCKLVPENTFLFTEIQRNPSDDGRLGVRKEGGRS